VFRVNEQPDLGCHGLRLLLISASVPSRQMRLLQDQYAPVPVRGKSRLCMRKVGSVGLLRGGWVLLSDDAAA